MLMVDDEISARDTFRLPRRQMKHHEFNKEVQHSGNKLMDLRILSAWHIKHIHSCRWQNEINSLCCEPNISASVR